VRSWAAIAVCVAEEPLADLDGRNGAVAVHRLCHRCCHCCCVARRCSSGVAERWISCGHEAKASRATKSSATQRSCRHWCMAHNTVRKAAGLAHDTYFTAQRAPPSSDLANRTPRRWPLRQAKRSGESKAFQRSLLFREEVRLKRVLTFSCSLTRSAQGLRSEGSVLLEEVGAARAISVLQLHMVIAGARRKTAKSSTLHPNCRNWHDMAYSKLRGGGCVGGWGRLNRVLQLPGAALPQLTTVGRRAREQPVFETELQYKTGLRLEARGHANRTPRAASQARGLPMHCRLRLQLRSLVGHYSARTAHSAL